MTKASIETVEVKEFSPEQAGEQVAWINVVENEESSLIMTSLAYARISSEGAHYSYETDGTRQLHSPDSVRGFEYSAELMVCGRDGKILDVTHGKSPGATIEPFSTESSDTGFANSLLLDKPSDGGTWALGNNEIVDAIKSELDSSEAEWMYPLIYYSLAQMADMGMLLADPDMHHITTYNELQGARESTRSLELIDIADKVMLDDLTVFGVVSPEDIPDRFTDERRHIHNLETQLTELRQQLHSGRFYSPLSAVRTWPYMDPTQADESVAFGRELRALKDRDITLAQYELSAEKKAVSRRLEAARRIQHHLGVLASKEITTV